MNRTGLCFVLSMVFISWGSHAGQLTNVPHTTPDSRYLVHDDGTVTDAQTGLMWKVCSEGEVWSEEACSVGSTPLLFTWSEAHLQANNSEFAGYSDWRLPNYKELASLLDHSRDDPAINLNIFFNSPSENYWSSTAGWRYDRNAMHVNFATGSAYFSGLESVYRVRLVRGGY